MDKDLDAPLEEEKGGASVQVDAGAIAQIM